MVAGDKYFDFITVDQGSGLLQLKHNSELFFPSINFSTYEHEENFNLTALYKGGSFKVYLKASTSAKDSLTNEEMIVYKEIEVKDRAIPPKPFENPGIMVEESSTSYNNFWVNKVDPNYFVDLTNYKLASYYWGNTDPYVWKWVLKTEQVPETSITLINTS